MLHGLGTFNASHCQGGGRGENRQEKGGDEPLLAELRQEEGGQTHTKECLSVEVVLEHSMAQIVKEPKTLIVYCFIVFAHSMPYLDIVRECLMVLEHSMTQIVKSLKH